MARLVRSIFPAAVLCLALCSCSGPTPPPPSDTAPPETVSPSAIAPSSGAPPTNVPSSPIPSAAPPTSALPVVPEQPTGSASGDAEPTALTTFAGSLGGVSYYFDHPAYWTVEDSAGDVDEGGTVSVLGPDGQQMASLTVTTFFGETACDPGDCMERPAVYFGDRAGQESMFVSGPFVVRSLAMDLAEFPEDRLRNGWPNNVRVVISISSDTGPPSTSYVPRWMSGGGLVETGIEAANGNTDRVVYFSSVQDFETLGEAQAYSRTAEHSQIQSMIASFREQ